MLRVFHRTLETAMGRPLPRALFQVLAVGRVRSAARPRGPVRLELRTSGRSGIKPSRRSECRVSGGRPESASLIGHLGQAQVFISAGRSRTRVTLLFAVWWSLLSGAAARMHRIRVWGALLRDALEAQQTFSASPIPSSASDVPARSGVVVRSGHAAASCDPSRKSEPSAHMRWSTTAILRATATIARRRPLVFISRTPQAFRLDQAIERISMALAAA
jgi:hypothetical protein